MILLAALASGGAARAQGIHGASPFGPLDPGRNGGSFPIKKHHHELSLSFWSSPGPVAWGGPFFTGPVYRTTTVVYYYSPPPVIVTPQPVVIVPRARPAYEEENELGSILRGAQRPRQEIQPALDDGEPASVFRPIAPADRLRARLPAPADPPPPKKKPPAQREQPPRDLAPLPGGPKPEATPQRENARQVKLGKEAFVAGEYGRAERRFHQAVDVLGTDALSQFLLAQARFAQGKYQEAVAAIESGLQLQPTWPSSVFRVRSLYGPPAADFDEQLGELKLALAAYPDDPVLLFLFGYQLWFDDRRDEARPYFMRAKTRMADPRLCDWFLQPLPGLPFPIR
jgi:hypothetical protein